LVKKESITTTKKEEGATQQLLLKPMGYRQLGRGNEITKRLKTKKRGGQKPVN